MALWLAVWRVLAVNVTHGRDCEGKAPCVALMRSVGTRSGNSVGEGDGIPSSRVTQSPRVSVLLPPFAAGLAWEVSADPGEYPKCD